MNFNPLRSSLVNICLPTPSNKKAVANVHTQSDVVEENVIELDRLPLQLPVRS